MKELPIKEAVCTRSGQMGPYSDTVTVYEVHTENGQEIDKEDLLPYCFNLCHRTKIQSQKEWREGNVKRKLFVKDGNSTMLFCKNITDNGAKALCSAIYRFAEQLGVEIEVTFLKTN